MGTNRNRRVQRARAKAVRRRAGSQQEEIYPVKRGQREKVTGGLLPASQLAMPAHYRALLASARDETARWSERAVVVLVITFLP